MAVIIPVKCALNQIQVEEKVLQENNKRANEYVTWMKTNWMKIDSTCDQEGVDVIRWRLVEMTKAMRHIKEDIVIKLALKDDEFLFCNPEIGIEYKKFLRQNAEANVDRTRAMNRHHHTRQNANLSVGF